MPDQEGVRNFKDASENFLPFQLSAGGLSGAGVSDDFVVRLWSTTDGRILHELPIDFFPTAIDVSASGQLMAIGSVDGSVQVLEPDAVTKLLEPTGADDAVTAIAFSSNDSLLASAHKGRLIVIWDLDGAGADPIYIVPNAPVAHMAFSPDARTLATAFKERTLSLWDSTTGEKLRTLEYRYHLDGPVAFSPDGQLLASASRGGDIRLWNPHTGETVRTIDTSFSGISALVFSPDSTMLAASSLSLWAGSFSSEVRLWSTESGALLHAFKTELWGRNLAFSKDGRFLIIAGRRGVQSRKVVGAWLTPPAPSPSPRSALISEALQRLWGLGFDGVDVVPTTWTTWLPREGYYTDQVFEIDVRTAAETADPTSQPIMRTFDIRPLLDPPRPDQDKLDQFLDWLAEQERQEQRLAPSPPVENHPARDQPPQ